MPDVTRHMQLPWKCKVTCKVGLLALITEHELQSAQVGLWYSATTFSVVHLWTDTCTCYNGLCVQTAGTSVCCRPTSSMSASGRLFGLLPLPQSCDASTTSCPQAPLMSWPCITQKPRLSVT